LAEQYPELRPVIRELERDHELVAGMLRSLEVPDTTGHGDRGASSGTRATERVARLVAYRDETASAPARLVLQVPGWPGHLAGQHVDVIVLRLVRTPPTTPGWTCAAPWR
jgi:hypothetical protein